MNIPLEEGNRLENLYKELHPVVYEHGNKEMINTLKNGYVENAAGFKLRLPFWEEFQELDKYIKTLDKEFWTKYRLGKEESKKYWETEDLRKIDQKLNAVCIHHRYALFRYPNKSRNRIKLWQIFSIIKL